MDPMAPMVPSRIPGPRPCCAPRKMAPLDILYLDADLNVVKAKIPNMKIKSCGCSFIARIKNYNNNK